VNQESQLFLAKCFDAWVKQPIIKVALVAGPWRAWGLSVARAVASSASVWTR
jgi:hypothetical protein